MGSRCYYLAIVLYACVLSSCKKDKQHSERLGPISFQKTYGTSMSENGGSVVQTKDGGYAIAGASDRHFYLVKTNEQGNMQWSRTYGNSNSAIDPFFLRQTSDGGYILTGSDYSDYNLVIVRANSAGDLMWSKKFSASINTWGFSCLEANDGGFIFAGQVDLDALIMKLDANGNLLWSHGFDAGSFEEALSLQKTSDGGYCLAGYTDTNGYLLKTDADGNLLWTKSYDLNGPNDEAFSVQQCADGGYIISGETGNLVTSTYDIYLLKTDNNGNIVWSKRYGSTGWNVPQTVLQTNDQGFLVIGTKYYDTDNSDIWLIKTDLNGNLAWSKTFGGAGKEFSFRNASGEQTSDGGYIIGGCSSSFGESFDLYLIKTDANGNSGCNQNDFMPKLTELIVHATDPNTTVSTSGTLNPLELTVASGGIESTICYK